MNETILQMLIGAAQARFDAMSPEQKDAMRREQKISFVYGQLHDCAPSVTKEEIANLIKSKEK